MYWDIINLANCLSQQKNVCVKTHEGGSWDKRIDLICALHRSTHCDYLEQKTKCKGLRLALIFPSFVCLLWPGLHLTDLDWRSVGIRGERSKESKAKSKADSWNGCRVFLTHKHKWSLSHYGYSLCPVSGAITTPTPALIELGPTLFRQGAY